MTDVTEMELRVAKATYAQMLASPEYVKKYGFVPVQWDAVPDEIRHDWISCARAAIRAMREPTERIARKGAQAQWDCGDLVGLPQATKIWQAMIDSASPPTGSEREK